MLPGIYDLELYRGDTVRRVFTLWQDAARTLPVDLTGVTANAQIRDRADSTSVVAEFDCTITMPNTVTIVLEAEEAAKLLTKGAWDLQLTYTGGDVATVVAGAVVVEADVTREIPVELVA